MEQAGGRAGGGAGRRWSRRWSRQEVEQAVEQAGGGAPGHGGGQRVRVVGKGQEVGQREKGPARWRRGGHGPERVMFGWHGGCGAAKECGPAGKKEDDVLGRRVVSWVWMRYARVRRDDTHGQAGAERSGQVLAAQAPGEAAAAVGCGWQGWMCTSAASTGLSRARRCGVCSG